MYQLKEFFMQFGSTGDINMVTYKRPTGTRDFLPGEMSVRNFVERVIRETFESHGFQQIQTPTFEEFELLGARSGEEIKEQMFTFVSDNVEYALRPELTAPVCRLVATGELDRFPQPYKLYYIGQCFRYERPQVGQHREFRQAGLELMGTTSPLADAEVMAIAVKVLENLGISEYKLKVGNIGVYRDILHEEQFDYDAQNEIISDIDHIMRLRERCEYFKTAPEYDDIEDVMRGLYQLQREIEYKGDYEIPPMRELDEDSLKEWGGKLAVAAEAIHKAVWMKREGLSENIANLLLEISRIRGNRDAIVEATNKFQSMRKDSIENLLEVCRWLEIYGVKNYEVALGIARGLDFYTGTTFEVDSYLLRSPSQICSGGRYDRLVSEFDGPDIPATGFAFAFPKLVETFEKNGDALIEKKVDCYIATELVSFQWNETNSELTSKAIEIAEMLRKAGKRVEINLMDRDLTAQLVYAAEIKCNCAIIVDESQGESVTLRDMQSGSEEIVKISELTCRL